MARLAGFAEGEDGETAAAEGAHGMEARRDRGARGDDIVHEQDMLMVHLLGMGDGEDILYVLRSIIGMEHGLLGIVYPAQEMLGIYGNTRHVRKAAGDPFGLVVAPLAKTLLMQGYRHNYVDSIEEIVRHELTGSNTRQLASYLRTLTVFHLMNSQTKSGVVVEKEEGCRREDMRKLTEELFRTVLTQKSLLRTGQGRYTVGAKRRPFFRHISATKGATVGEQDRQEALSEHGSRKKEYTHGIALVRVRVCAIIIRSHHS